jgi:general secretion pathway protein G
MPKYTTKSGKINRQRRAPAGFTLIEVMLVLFILLIMAGAGVLAWQGVRERANRPSAELFIRSMKTPLDQFNLTVGRYPTTEEGLGALLTCPATLTDPSKWDGPYLEGTITGIDPWGNPYQYQYPGRSPGRYDLWSVGPDLVGDTEDDICSWK